MHLYAWLYNQCIFHPQIWFYSMNSWCFLFLWAISPPNSSLSFSAPPLLHSRSHRFTTVINSDHKSIVIVLHSWQDFGQPLCFFLLARVSALYSFKIMNNKTLPRLCFCSFWYFSQQQITAIVAGTTTTTATTNNHNSKTHNRANVSQAEWSESLKGLSWDDSRLNHMQVIKRAE